MKKHVQATTRRIGETAEEALAREATEGQEAKQTAMIEAELRKTGGVDQEQEQLGLIK